MFPGVEMQIQSNVKVFNYKKSPLCNLLEARFIDKLTIISKRYILNEKKEIVSVKLFLKVQRLLV